MRFNSEAYDKLFPRQEEVSKPIESSVSTFTPTTDKIEEQSVGDLNNETDISEGRKESGDGVDGDNNTVDN